MAQLCRQARLLSARAGSYLIDIGATAHPHPRKRQGDPGEDAHHISLLGGSDRAVLAVADGVGAVSGPFARELMHHVGAYTASSESSDPAAVLHYAWQAARPTEGRSTACVCIVADGQLRCSNLGDSGFRVITRSPSGRLRFAAGSAAQQHSFNVPFQLGVLHSEELNSAADAQAFESPLELSGAVVLCATDGLFDTLFPIEILNLLHDGLRSGADAQALSARLADTALELSRDPQRLSPAFLALAQQDLIARSREAQDDMTVVVGVIGEP